MAVLTEHIFVAILETTGFTLRILAKEEPFGILDMETQDELRESTVLCKSYTSKQWPRKLHAVVEKIY